ncbi:MAG: hypothetical protein LUC88_05310, partial [Prevotella sp.]|nr:hypothetical protein [Prevotella sp.]
IMKVRILIILFLLNCFLVTTHAQTLTDSDKKEIEQRIIEKVNDFVSYLPEIAAKSNKKKEERETASEYIAIALKLFIGEGEKYPYIDNAGNKRLHDEVTMQTTSRGKKNPPQPMVNYLNGLMALPYHKVKVDTCYAVRINKEIHEVGDGLYTATALFVQSFRAYRDNRLVLNDKDPKQVTVYIKREVINDYSGKSVYWVIKLGDIRVTSNY